MSSNNTLALCEKLRKISINGRGSFAVHSDRKESVLTFRFYNAGESVTGITIFGITIITTIFLSSVTHCTPSYYLSERFQTSCTNIGSHEDVWEKCTGRIAPSQIGFTLSSWPRPVCLDFVHEVHSQRLRNGSMWMRTDSVQWERCEVVRIHSKRTQFIILLWRHALAYMVEGGGAGMNGMPGAPECLKLWCSMRYRRAPLQSTVVLMMRWSPTCTRLTDFDLHPHIVHEFSSAYSLDTNSKLFWILLRVYIHASLCNRLLKLLLKR